MNRTPLIALLTANAVSMVGNVLALIAIPWFVLETTDSPAKTGVTGFCITLAAVVATFFGGTIVDRLGFKRTSITADMASGLAFALIPLLHATVGLAFWQLLALVFIGNFLDAPGTTAREALIPELAQVAGMGLERASALIQAVERGSRMVGAPLAGALIAVIGVENVVWIDAASFGISALIVCLWVPLTRPAAVSTGATGRPRRYFDDVREGLQYIVSDRLLLAIVLVVVATNFLDAPITGVIYPVYFQRFFGNALDLGLVVSASGAGALITALIFGAVGHKLPRRAVFFAGFALTTLRFFIFPLVPPIWALVLISLISGCASGPINPIISTVSYERIPAQYRGRVLGTMTSVAYVAMPLGTVLAGFALEHVDIRVLLVAFGGIYLATIAAGLFSPTMRQLDSPKPSLLETESLEKA